MEYCAMLGLRKHFEFLLRLIRKTLRYLLATSNHVLLRLDAVEENECFIGGLYSRDSRIPIVWRN